MAAHDISEAKKSQKEMIMRKKSTVLINFGFIMLPKFGKSLAREEALTSPKPKENSNFLDFECGQNVIFLTQSRIEVNMTEFNLNLIPSAILI